MEAQEVIERLKLLPLPREGGWYAETWSSSNKNGAGRSYASLIYYLITADDFSAIHRLDMDEVYHFYAGDPVEQLQLSEGGSAHLAVLGSDLARGEVPQMLVPAGAWQGSRLKAGGRWALLGCSVTPAWDVKGFELGERHALEQSHPQWTFMIRALTR